jgi:L-ribulose-5-phosphate 3-epimerase
MQWPIQISYLTIGGFAGETPVSQAIRQAKEFGYDGLELSFGDGEIVAGIDKTKCEEIRNAASDAGMQLRTMATGKYWGQSLSDPREEVRQQAIEFTKDYLWAAYELGIETILVVPGHVAVPWDDSQPVIPYAKAWELSTLSLRECLPLAEDLGINIAIENVWNWFLADPMSMRLFVDQFNSPRLGVYFDAGNVLINGYPEHWVEILGDRIKAVHVKNFSRNDCGGLLHGFGDDLLTGDLNWPVFTQALQTINYTGTITAEMIPFCRIPDLVLPDLELAKKTGMQMNELFK